MHIPRPLTVLDTLIPLGRAAAEPARKKRRLVGLMLAASRLMEAAILMRHKRKTGRQAGRGQHPNWSRRTCRACLLYKRQAHGGGTSEDRCIDRKRWIRDGGSAGIDPRFLTDGPLLEPTIHVTTIHPPGLFPSPTPNKGHLTPPHWYGRQRRRCYSES